MSKETFRTFLIMSHGSWPEKIINTDVKGRQFAKNGELGINFKGYNSSTHNRGGKYKNVADTVYKIPNKTRLFTTTNYGKLAVVCPKYDKFIKEYIRKYGLNIFTSPQLRKSLNQKYEFIKNSRLYTDGNQIVNIDISFEQDAESWNIWERVGTNLNKVSWVDLKKKYKLSEIIDKLTSKRNGGIAVPNQRSHIILHCCMPYLDNWTWSEDEYENLESKIKTMMNRGTFKIQNVFRANKFQEKKTKTRHTNHRITTRSRNIEYNSQVRTNDNRSESKRIDHLLLRSRLVPPSVELPPHILKSMKNMKNMLKKLKKQKMRTGKQKFTMRKWK